MLYFVLMGVEKTFAAEKEASSRPTCFVTIHPPTHPSYMYPVRSHLFLFLFLFFCKVYLYFVYRYILCTRALPWHTAVCCRCSLYAAVAHGMPPLLVVWRRCSRYAVVAHGMLLLPLVFNLPLRHEGKEGFIASLSLEDGNILHDKYGTSSSREHQLDVMTLLLMFTVTASSSSFSFCACFYIWYLGNRVSLCY